MNVILTFNYLHFVLEYFFFSHRTKFDTNSFKNFNNTVFLRCLHLWGKLICKKKNVFIQILTKMHKLRIFIGKEAISHTND